MASLTPSHSLSISFPLTFARKYKGDFFIRFIRLLLFDQLVYSFKVLPFRCDFRHKQVSSFWHAHWSVGRHRAIAWKKICESRYNHYGVLFVLYAVFVHPDYDNQQKQHFEHVMTRHVWRETLFERKMT